MKKILAILFSVVVTVGAITVLGASVSDPYEFDGDVITNPFWWLYTTEASSDETTTEAPSDETTTEAPSDETTKEPSEEEWVEIIGSNPALAFYYDKANMTVNDVVSVQKPTWAAETGIYLNVTSGISTVTVNGESENVATIDGAGAVVYLSALKEGVNEVVIKHALGTSTVAIKKVVNSDETTVKPEEPTTRIPTGIENWLEVTGSSAATKYYYDEGNMTVNDVISIQKPDWATETGIYVNVLSGISKVTVNGETENVGAYDGAGAIIYLSALKEGINEVSIEHALGTSVVSIKKEVVAEETTKKIPTGVENWLALVDWDALDKAHTYYYDEGNMTVNEVVSVQKPDWSEAAGIYVSVEAGVSKVTVNGETENVAAIDGAGAVIYLSALKDGVNEIVIEHGVGTSTVSIKKEVKQEEETTTKTEVELKITSQPKNITAASGEAISASVVAEGEGLTYQWQISSDAGKTWKDSTAASAKTATFTLTMKDTYDAKQLRCVVTDSTGKSVASDAATITLKKVEAGELTIVSQPTNVTVPEGEAARFTVVAKGDGLKYQWQMSTDDGATWKALSSASAKTAQLTCNMKNEYDARQFRCVVKDSAGKTVTSNVAILYLDTDKTIIFTVQPKCTYVAVGATAFLEVRAKGTGLTYQWQMSTDGGVTWRNPSSASAKTRMYGFQMKENYAGMQFRCVVTDVNGESVISDTVVIGIGNGLPIVIKSQPSSTRIVKEGNSTLFIIDAEGEDLKYQWQMSTDNGQTWKNTTASGANTAMFGFNVKSSYNGRQLRCIITDANGNSVISKTITIVCR
ncbi:hypothetical protein [uncultured Eubacterium sp.]|uniref:hypothetical protein n=1 Tax=uncultured Eubacterium sp. TaxID=165185 RepID=UPI002671E789|nr:hypothetical protein [uncultured Eubacterium sp.]